MPKYCLCCSEGPGVYDVCEKDAADVMECLTNQQKEDLTASAQVYQYYRHLCYIIIIIIIIVVVIIIVWLAPIQLFTHMYHCTSVTKQCNLVLA